MGAILYGIDVPPYGGDTMFANQYLAYESLSDGMKKMLAGLRAVHSDIMVAGPQAGKNKGRSTKHRDGADWRETRNSHPVVRTNPETGRKMLFVNKSYTVGFEGMTEAESKPLLDFLIEHGNRPEFTFRYPLAEGLDRLLGQSQHQAHRGGRHRPVPPPDAAASRFAEPSRSSPPPHSDPSVGLRRRHLPRRRGGEV
jgi:hypothetical protein